MVSLSMSRLSCRSGGSFWLLRAGVVLKALLAVQQGKGDVLFHHAGGNAHALGDLCLAQAFEAVKHKGFSPARREFGEDVFQLFQALQALGGGHGFVLFVGTGSASLSA